tara:strand:- start:1286 stop:7930 length:6645 start_codon:yes stop_codon:yes gene_type:complete
MGLLDITKAVAKGVKNDFESSAIYKLGDNILGGVSESSPESDDPVVLGGPSSNLEEPVTRFVNWGFNLIEGAVGSSYTLGKEVLFDGVILRSLGQNGTPLWEEPYVAASLFEFVTDDIAKDFLGIDMDGQGGVPEHALFGPKGFASGVVGAVPEEIRNVVREPIEMLGTTWSYALNQMVDNPLSIMFTMFARHGFNPVSPFGGLIDNLGKNREYSTHALFDINEWKQAHDIVYKGNRTMAQSLAVAMVNIDPFDREAYNSLEAEWWFDMFTGTVDFAKEIWLDPVEKFGGAALKLSRGATVIAKVGKGVDDIKIYDFGISDNSLRTATPQTTILIGPNEGRSRFTIIREPKFYSKKQKAKVAESQRVSAAMDLPPGPNFDSTYGWGSSSLGSSGKRTVGQTLGVKTSITKIQAEKAADSKWFEDTYNSVIEDVAGEGLSIDFKHGGVASNLDAKILDRRISKFLKYGGRKFDKDMPDKVVNAIATAPSLKAAKLVFRNYQGDLTVKIDIDDVVREAHENIGGEWKQQFADANKKEFAINKRKSLIEEQKTKETKLRKRIEGTATSKKIKDLRSQLELLKKQYSDEGTKTYKVSLSNRLTKNGVQETAAQAQNRMRLNARKRILNKQSRIEQNIEELSKADVDELATVNKNIKRNETWVKNRETELEELNTGLLAQSDILNQVHWEHHFDFDSIVRESQQKKYSSNNTGGFIDELDPLDTLSTSDNMLINVLVDGIAENIVRGSDIAARTGNGKVYRPLNHIHRKNMARLKADSTRDVAMQRHWIPSTFEPGGFRMLRFITQRVPQGLIHFDDLGGQSYVMFERMLESASAQRFKYGKESKQIIEVSEVEELLGTWKRMSANNADFVAMSKFYLETVKKLNSRAEDIFIDAKIRVNVGDGVTRLVKKGELDEWLSKAKAGFIDRVNKKTGKIQDQNPSPTTTVTDTKEYLESEGNRLRGKLRSDQPEVQNIVDTFGEENVSMLMSNGQGLDILLFNMSPSQVTKSALVPRWDMLGVEFNKAVGNKNKLGIKKQLRREDRTTLKQFSPFNTMRNVWTSGKLLTPRWTARVLTDEKMRMAAIFGMQKTFATLQKGKNNYQQRLAANGLNFSEDGFDIALREEYVDLYGKEIVENGEKIFVNDASTLTVIAEVERKSKAMGMTQDQFIDNAIKRNIKTQKQQVKRRFNNKLSTYESTKVAGAVGRILFGSAVSPVLGLGWAGKHWHSRTKAIQQLGQKNASETLAQAYQDAGRRLLEDAGQDIANKEEYLRIVSLIDQRAQRMDLALSQLETDFGFAITDKEKIVGIFDKANSEWNKAGYPRLEIGNVSFQNAYGSDQRWHRMVKEQISSRRSTDSAVRGFIDAERTVLEEAIPQNWTVYDLSEAGNTSRKVKQDSWNTHYKQLSATGPITKSFFDVLYDDTLDFVTKQERIAKIIDEDAAIRERLGINRYEGLDGDKELLKLVATDLIDEVDDLLPPELFPVLRKKAKEGQEVSWNDVEAVLKDPKFKKTYGIESKEVKEIIKKVREIRTENGRAYTQFGMGRGASWVSTDHGAIQQYTRKVMDKGFENFGTMASDTISRQPFFEEVYTTHILETVQPYRNADGTYTLTPTDVKKIETEAREQAIKKTRDVLYELSEHTQLAEMVGFHMPFFNAYQEVIGRWAGLALENPQFVGKGTYFYTKDNYELPLLGIQQEENEFGNQVMVFRPANSDLVKLFTSVPFFKELGNVAKIVHDLPTGVPGYTGLGGDLIGSTGMTFDRNGLLSMIQQTSPNFGPFITIPIRDTMLGVGPFGAKPELEELFGWLYPFGHPDGNALERFVQDFSPTWAKHAWYATSDYGFTNSQSWDRTVVEQVALIDAQLRENGINPSYSNEKQQQDIFNQAKERARAIGILKVFGATVIPVAVDDASPFVEMISKYKEWKDIERLIGEDGFADDLFFARYGKEFFMLTNSVTKNNLGVNTSIKSWRLKEEYKDLIERHPTLAPALTDSLRESDIIRATTDDYSPAVRQNMLNDGDIEYLTPEQFVKNAEIRRGWAEWEEWLDTPNTAFSDSENLDSNNSPTPRDVQHARNGVTSSLQADINTELNEMFNLKIEELSMQYPLWAEAKQEYESPTFYRDFFKGIEELVDDPSIGINFKWYNDLIGEDGYLEERKAIQIKLFARSITQGSANLLANDNLDLLVEWAAIQDQFMSRPNFSSFYERYLANDLIPRNSWMD